MRVVIRLRCCLYLDEMLEEFLSWLLLITLLGPGAIALSRVSRLFHCELLQQLEHTMNGAERDTDSAVQSSQIFFAGF